MILYNNSAMNYTHPNNKPWGVARTKTCHEGLNESDSVFFLMRLRMLFLFNPSLALTLVLISSNL